MMIKADVVVCGAGPAGVSAAIYAAKQGAKTILIEKDSTVGGMATAGLLNVFCGVSDGNLFQEYVEKWVKFDKDGRLLYDPEELMQYFLEKLENAGVHLLLNAKLYRANLSSKKIENIEVATTAGSEQIQGRIYVDATGDGLLACLSGVPYVLGNENGDMQPMSMMVMLGGVDNAPYLTFGMRNDLQEKMQRLGKKMVGDAGHIILIPCCRPGYAVINMTNCAHVDGTDPWDYTKAQLVCRKQLPDIVEFLRKEVPGCKNCYVLETAAYAGIRESRHFKGVSTIQENDILSGRVFEDWCVTGACMSMNLHNTQGSGLDKKTISQEVPYTIPYSALITHEIDNLLLSGRMISGTHRAHGSFRAISICMGTGQAAGTAAAICAALQQKVQEIDIKVLQEILAGNGMKA